MEVDLTRNMAKVAQEPGMETEAEVTLDIANVNSLNDVLDRLQDSYILNIIDSITFDVKSQKIILQVQRLVRNTLIQEADEIQRGRTSVNPDPDSAEAKIIKLSETYRHKYPELLAYFKEWKPCREKLIDTLKNAADSLERNSTYVSTFRILTSVADIFGTLARTGGQSAGSLSDFAMENASTFGILALFVEMILSKNTFNAVKKTVKKDRDLLKNVIQWLKQTEELDAAVKSFFPYGIDSEIVQKIERISPNAEDYSKIFMSIVASNVKKNVQLFKNKEFLDKAERVSTSEVGKQWFHKVILENDPYLKDRLNSELCTEIQEILRSINGELSPTENREMYVEACRLLKNKANMKVFISVCTILGAANNLFFQDRPQASDLFENLAEITEQELTKIKDVVRLLKPSEIETDPALM